MKLKGLLILLIGLVFSSCSTFAPPAPTRESVVSPTIAAPAPTITPTPTRVAPYEQYTIDYLRSRTYGGGRIEVTGELGGTESFTSYSIRYPSDGLNIYGFVNVPNGSGPYPVLISIHGYARADRYDAFNVSLDSADALAENAFIVIHPALRNYPPSDSGDNILRVGMTVDVLNLIALVEAQAGQPGALAPADPHRIGLWGMSMGGSIALRVLTIHPDIKAAVLYSPMGGDEERNSRQLYEVTRDPQFQKDLEVPPGMNDRISPAYYYHLIKAPVQLHHGTGDTTAPISWAVETCEFLEAAGVSVQCVYHQGVEHVFGGESHRRMFEQALEFYRNHLFP
jgi:dipeptidyl aminopeptidase/acylaminoacyl peptidase